MLLLVDTVLYMVLAWYIEAVFPGKYGVAKPFYFPLQPSFWLSQKGRGCSLGDKCWSMLKGGSVHHVKLEEEEEEEEEGTEMSSTYLFCGYTVVSPF